MKKTLVLSALGVVAFCASSQAQGYINFSTYTANGQPAYFQNTTTGIGVGYTAMLYYAFGTVSDSVNTSSADSITSLPTGLTLLAGVTGAYDNSGVATGAQGLGYFDAGNAVIPGYVSGPITFELVAFNGSSYENSTIRGRSGTWTETSIVASSSLSPSQFGDTVAMPITYVATVTPVPEPSTLALAGLGGFGMLMALRRKKA